MHNSKIKRISLAVCLALMPFAADAAGLGRLTVFSGLGEPLNAEIEISAVKEELSTLSARIAPPETYAEQGLERPAALGGIKLEIGSQADGQPVLKLTSAQPVNDPFLDMLIQMEWSTGRLLREYTALLDPPGYGDQKSATAVPPKIAAAAQPLGASTVPVAKAAVEKKGRHRKGPAAPTAEKPESAQGEPSEGYTTQAGDTLHGIAKQMQVEGVSLEQMLVGLYRANKDAFIDGNMNRLKVGKIVRTPSSEELQAVSQPDAVKEIRVQTADWNAYRNKLAGAVAEAAPAGEEARGQAVSGKITSAAEEKATPAPSSARDVVKLSKSDVSAAKPGAPETESELRAKLNAQQEEATAREKAAKEADARVAALEKQVQDMQKLVELKNKAMADMQKAAPVVAPQPTPPVAQPSPVEAKPAETKPVEAKQPVAPATAAPQTEAPQQPKKPRKPRPQPVAEPEPTPEPSFLEDPVMLGGIGGSAIALLGGGWLYLRNKRRKGLESFEKGILTTSGLKPNTVFGSTAGGTVDTGDTSFLTDLSQGAGMIDTNEVDPIAEAEVYMAYGRDVQAEEILKDAIGKDPKRYELHQKLLEIYANRKDTAAFETLAGELYAMLGATDPNWLKFAAMGRALEPENPLYAAQAAAEIPQGTPTTQQFSPTVFAAPEADIDIGADTVIAPEPEQALEGRGEAAARSASMDNSLDFDLELSGVGGTGEQAESGALPAIDVGAVTGAPELEAEPTAGTDSGLEFSLELPEPAAAESVQLEAAEIGLEPSLNLPEAITTEVSEPEAAGIDFELPELSFEPTPTPNVAAEESPAPLVVAPEISATAVAEAKAEPVQEQMPEITFELPAAEVPAVPSAAGIQVPEAEAPAEEIVFNTAPTEGADLDFNFDMDLGGVEAAAAEKPQAGAPALPELDLSGISLELEETPAVKPIAPAAAELPAEVVEEITLAGDESADVDTKLDLVAAYMDMGDTEGARELLEEVLKEGGPKQRERAKGILDTLG